MQKEWNIFNRSFFAVSVFNINSRCLKPKSTYMRKLFLFLLLCYFCQLCYAQQIEPTKNQTSLEVYKKRRATFKTAGWISLGTGLLLAGTSFHHYFIKNRAYGSWDSEPVFFIGGGLMIASIPLFILARQNKIKAGLAFRPEKVQSPLAALNTPYAALSFQINW